MGHLWEGSTGARALAILRELPQGTIIRTPDFAPLLGVSARALHQLLANSVRLRLIKKVRRRGWNSVGWALGAGNDSANIERRRPPTGKPRVRRRPSDPPPAPKPMPEGARRFLLSPPWPPGFVAAAPAPHLMARAVGSTREQWEFEGLLTVTAAKHSNAV
ncbi:MAG TPA: hypothetical protein VF457_06155 [Burkholderiaceae bacterium]